MNAFKFQVSDAWLRLYENIASDPGIVLLLGAPDTGKTTLAHFLTYKSMQGGANVSYIDGDLGQSVVGPPTTLGMASPVRPPVDMEAIGWDRLYFIGATSPAAHLLATAAGIKRLCGLAKAAGSDIVVVDTSGLVAGAMGFELKFYKIQLLAPRHIVAIQKNSEVEHILRACHRRQAIKIHRLSPGQEVQPRSPEVRRAYRATKFQRYFKNCSRKTVSLRDVAFVHPELPLLSYERMDEGLHGRLVGLNDEAYFALALGIWEGVNPDTHEVTLLTPWEDMSTVTFIHMGDISISMEE